MSLAVPVAQLVIPLELVPTPTEVPTEKPIGTTSPLPSRRRPTAPNVDLVPIAAPHDWELTAAERDEISHSITQTWTDQAIKCYMTGANCANCEIPRGNYSFVCQMNKVVAVLMETLGEPDINRVKKLYPPGLVRAMQA